MDDACTTRPPWQHTVATTRRRVVARRWRRETLLATRLTHARPRRLLHPLLALPAVFLLLLASPRALVRSRVVLSGDANLRLPATAAARGAASGAGSADAAAWPSTREGAPPGKPFSSTSTAGSDSDSALESGSAASRRVASHAQWAAAIAESLTRREREDGDGETGGEDEDEGRTPRAGLKREAVTGRAAPIVLPLQRQVRRAHSRERKTGGGGRAGAGEEPREGGGGEAGTRRRQLRGLPLDLRGSVLELGYYYVTLYLGWPPQRFALIADTGSSITYVPCAACTHCGNHQVRCGNHQVRCGNHQVRCGNHQVRCGNHQVRCGNHQVRCGNHQVRCGNHQVRCGNHQVRCGNHQVRCGNHQVRCGNHQVRCGNHQVRCGNHQVRCGNHQVRCSNHQLEKRRLCGHWWAHSTGGRAALVGAQHWWARSTGGTASWWHCKLVALQAGGTASWWHCKLVALQAGGTASCAVVQGGKEPLLRCGGDAAFPKKNRV
ncbi:unnamed protein product [Closterium sp. NIES-54]